MNKPKMTERREWKTPEVRSVIPARRTQGGIFQGRFVENPFYTVS